MNKTVEQGISDIVGCLTDPIIVFPGGWGDTLPDWLKTAITLERMMGDMKALKGEEPTGTDTEAENILDVIMKNLGASPQELTEKLLSVVQKHVDKAPQADDMTLLVIKRS